MGVYLTVKEKIRSRLDDLLAELRSLDQDPESEIKVQRILRFLEVPSAFEKVILFFLRF